MKTSERGGYFETVLPTYLERWPESLREISITQIDIPLTTEEAIALGSNILEYSEGFPEPAHQDITGIARRLEQALTHFPDGAFVRLGSRSPKDSWLGCAEGFKVTTSERAIRLLCDVSERISDDLHLALCSDYAPHLFVRQWMDIEPWAEFRCFCKNGQLVGISQYDYHQGRLPEIADRAQEIESVIHGFFTTTFLPRTHLQTVVFDVFLSPDLQKVTLLEINPFFEYTDPCLFEGRGFNGEFLYCTEARKEVDYSSFLRRVPDGIELEEAGE